MEGEFESLFIETKYMGQLQSLEKYIIEFLILILWNPLERYEIIVDRLKHINADIILGIDQNFDYLKYESDKYSTDLLDTFLEGMLMPCKTRPMRITSTITTLIDNICVRPNSQNLRSGIIISSISDHLPIFCFLGISPQVRIKDPLGSTEKQMQTTL